MSLSDFKLINKLGRAVSPLRLRRLLLSVPRFEAFWRLRIRSKESEAAQPLREVKAKRS